MKADNVIYYLRYSSQECKSRRNKKSYDTLEKTLKSYGATFQNVVRENLFTTGIEGMKRYNDTRKVYYKGDFPAATRVQIPGLFMADARLEIELVAYLPK